MAVKPRPWAGPPRLGTPSLNGRPGGDGGPMSPEPQNAGQEGPPKLGPVTLASRPSRARSSPQCQPLARALPSLLWPPPPDQRPLPGCRAQPSSVTYGPRGLLSLDLATPLSKQGGRRPCRSGPRSSPAPGRQAALLIPDAEDLLRVLLTVGRGGDDEQSVQEVDRDAVGALVTGTPDPGEEGEGRAVRIDAPGAPLPLLGLHRTPPPPQPTHRANTT